jgi:hypothetical protein
MVKSFRVPQMNRWGGGGVLDKLSERTVSKRKSSTSLSLLRLGRNFFPHGATAPNGPGPPHYRGFTITLRHTTHSVGLPWTSDRPDAEASTWQHTTLTRDKTSMLPAGFEPALPARERLQTHALYLPANGIGFGYTAAPNLKWFNQHQTGVDKEEDGSYRGQLPYKCQQQHYK